MRKINYSYISSKYKSNLNKSILNSKKTIHVRHKLLGTDSLSSFDLEHPKIITPRGESSSIPIENNSQPKKNNSRASSQKRVIKRSDCKNLSISIMSKIDIIMINYEKNTTQLYYILKKFDNFINKLIQDEEINLKENMVKNDSFELNSFNKTIEKQKKPMESKRDNKKIDFYPHIIVIIIYWKASILIKKLVNIKEK